MRNETLEKPEIFHLHLNVNPPRAWNENVPWQLAWHTITPLVPPAAHFVLLYMWTNCVPECLGSKPLSCGVTFSSLFIFPLLVSLSASILFPSSHDKHSGLLIRLGKNKTSSSLHLRKGKSTFDKRPPPHRQKTPAGRRRPGMAPRRRCDGRSWKPRPFCRVEGNGC